MPDGNALRNSVNSLLKPQKAAARDKRLVSKEGTAVSDIKVMLGRCARNTFLPPLRSPTTVYGGRLGLAADACMISSRASGGGWGSLAGRYYSMGDWPEAVKVAIERKKISIAFLEFYAILYAARMALVHREEWDLPPATEHFRLVGRSDNEAVCYLTASRLATKPLMRLCLRSLRELEREFNFSLLADHIAGVDNHVPDAMFRDDMARKKRVSPFPSNSSPVRFGRGIWLEPPKYSPH